MYIKKIVCLKLIKRIKNTIFVQLTVLSITTCPNSPIDEACRMHEF